MIGICMKCGTLIYDNIPGEMPRGFSKFQFISLKKCIYFYVKNAETEN